METSVYLGAFSKAAEMLIPLLYWLIPIAILTTVLKSSWFKGILGEWVVNFIINRNFKQLEYTLFKDVLLPTEDGTTQLDHVLVSPYGIFVLETKNMKGWIFGSEKQAKWTQQIYKHKSSFQNPLRQNYKHTQVLQELLALNDDCIHSLIVFVGSAVFKTPMPKNVVRGGGVSGFIKSFKTPILDEEKLLSVSKQLTDGRLVSSFKNKRAHIKHVNRIVDSKSEPKKDIKSIEPLTSNGCPKCGNVLKLRIAAKGAHKGTKFYGCSSFPKCRYIKKLA